MQALKTLPGDSRTFLTHTFGRGLEDERYVGGQGAWDHENQNI